MVVFLSLVLGAGVVVALFRDAPVNAAIIALIPVVGGLMTLLVNKVWSE